MSEQFLNGFTCAASYHVLFSQLRHLLGIKFDDVDPSPSSHHSGHPPFPLKYFTLVNYVHKLVVNLDRINVVSIGLSLLVLVMLIFSKYSLDKWIQKRLMFNVSFVRFVHEVCFDHRFACRYCFPLNLSSSFSVFPFRTPLHFRPCIVFPQWASSSQVCLDREYHKSGVCCPTCGNHAFPLLSFRLPLPIQLEAHFVINTTTINSGRSRKNSSRVTALPLGPIPTRIGRVKYLRRRESMLHKRWSLLAAAIWSDPFSSASPVGRHCRGVHCNSSVVAKRNWSRWSIQW